MNVGVKVSLKNVDPEKWAENHNGPWPEDDKRALITAVRQDIRETVQHHLKGIYAFEALDIEVEVR